ncbi:COX15/CtaA family protein [Limnochorda pilosa]|uniref:Cytochrome aa3 oxidase assembly protein n=1 Tax=Limnochorda pilosa TaxID=1555112 RepID=A0A0K2SFU1_LIMPI|nr:COX15/CtaA family protein [Limnochorda pilosa]BAS25960.1 cytochrome aa3 oxidase assembly protein [Limnochorda pilosa]
MTWLRRLSTAAAVGMFFLLASGVLVTTTGSAAGCGNAWPFCDGDWNTLATWIEVNHRAVTGVLGLLILAVSVLAWRQLGHRRDVRRLVGASLGFLLLQSWLGAAAVMWGSSPPVLATHFGVSLGAFGAVLLLAVRVRQLATGRSYRGGPVPARFRSLLWVSLAWTVGVVYVGAYLRHTHTGLACLGWPLCNGVPVPPLGTAAFVGFVHRLLAGVLILLVAYAGHLTRPYRQDRPDLFRGSLAALALLLLQTLSGWLVVGTLSSIAANVIHSSLVTLFTGVLLYLAMETAPEASTLEERRSVAV